jgi:hypothetical protein
MKIATISPVPKKFRPTVARDRFTDMVNFTGFTVQVYSVTATPTCSMNFAGLQTLLTL